MSDSAVTIIVEEPPESDKLENIVSNTDLFKESDVNVTTEKHVHPLADLSPIKKNFLLLVLSLAQYIDGIDGFLNLH